jgi:hypothetical protein
MRRLLNVLSAAMLFLAAPTACGQEEAAPGAASPAETFDLQGHRGARGLLPENTLQGFEKALALGVTTLELDLAISRDGKVVVSHEPWFSSQICSRPDGTPVTEDEAQTLSLYALSYEEIARFDCGQRGHPSFPEQQPVAAAKPLPTATAFLPATTSRSSRARSTTAASTHPRPRSPGASTTCSPPTACWNAPPCSLSTRAPWKPCTP